LTLSQDFGLSRMAPDGAAGFVDPEEIAENGKMTEYVVTRWYRPPELMLYPGKYTAGNSFRLRLPAS